MDLNNKEKVHTGDGGRALLRMAEGSAVKLGESAMLAVDDLVQKQDAKGGVVGASLEVVRGAFRFTTGLLGKSNSQRDVRVKVNTITAGIRGTDVWGKSESDRDIVCLLEGRITVAHGAAQFAMPEPNSFYIAPRKGPAQPASRVSVEQVKEWSAETEIDPRSGAVCRGGTFRVTVASSNDERSANAQGDKLRDPFSCVSLAWARRSSSHRIPGRQRGCRYPRWVSEASRLRAGNAGAQCARIAGATRGSYNERVFSRLIACLPNSFPV